MRDFRRQRGGERVHTYLRLFLYPVGDKKGAGKARNKGEWGCSKMDVLSNRDKDLACNNCLSRTSIVEVKIYVGGMGIMLCSECRKELQEKLIWIC